MTLPFQVVQPYEINLFAYHSSQAVLPESI